MLLEVIATSLQDSLDAERFGADRIELISNVSVGGLTPDDDLIQKVVNSVRIPVNVMVRPHSHSFQYNKEDVQRMIHDIRRIRQFKANGVVLGALTAQKQVDADILNRLTIEAGSMDVTFHRAFDEVENQIQALDILFRFPQVNRLLTSGGLEKASDATRQIRDLVDHTKGSHLSILAGGGLTLHSLESFIKHTGIKEVHFGSAVRVRNSSLESMEGDKIKEVKRMIMAVKRMD